MPNFSYSEQLYAWNAKFGQKQQIEMLLSLTNFFETIFNRLYNYTPTASFEFPTTPQPSHSLHLYYRKIIPNWYMQNYYKYKRIIICFILNRLNLFMPKLAHATQSHATALYAYCTLDLKVRDGGALCFVWSSKRDIYARCICGRAMRNDSLSPTFSNRSDAIRLFSLSPSSRACNVSR